MASTTHSLTAEQAMHLFSQKIDDDAESDISFLSDSSNDSFNFNNTSESDNNDNPCSSASLIATPTNFSEPSKPRKRKSLSAKNKGKKKARLSHSNPDNVIEDLNVPTWHEINTDSKETSLTYQFTPQRSPGVSKDINHTSNAFQCLQKILTPTVMDNLIRSINEFALLKSKVNNPSKRRSVYANWKPLSREELIRFIVVIIVIGMDNRPRIRDYFTQNPAHWYTPWFSQIFPSRDRFLSIYHTMLHTGEAGAQEKEKIEPFINELVSSFQNSFYPFQELAIDEMIIGFKGRWANKQYNAAKPHKYHIKTFGLCDSLTGYVFNLLLYYGRDTSYAPETDPSSMQAVKVFQTLITDNIAKGHIIYADRYYSALPVVRYLQSRKIHFTGTVMPNRKGLPTQLKTEKLLHRESKWYLTEKEDIMCVTWRDKKAKKPVVMVSTKSVAEMVTAARRHGESVKPAMVHAYNKAMNGCDKADQNIGYYGPFGRKSNKWWRKIFFWMLEIAQFNSHILYTLSHPDQKRMPLRNFKDQLIRQMQEHVTLIQTVPSAQPVLVERFTSSSRHLIQYTQKDRNCVYCSTSQNRRRTKFFCSGCSDHPFLHPKHCFYAYHSKTTN